MTKGNIVPLLVSFSLPILLGQLFQQLYNTFDTWCVGNYVGKNSFSAVGTVSSIINMLIGFAGGFSTGAGVVISQYFGAGDEKNISRAVHTFVVFMIALGLIMTVFGIMMVGTWGSCSITWALQYSVQLETHASPSSSLSCRH